MDEASEALSQGAANISQGDEEDFLKKTFEQLGVGRDGFLTSQELEKVCLAIGMENVAEEVFKRLDTKGDGKIRFNDLLFAFQNDRLTETALDVSNDSCPDNSILSDSPCIPSTSVSGMTFVNDVVTFLSLDPESTGYVPVTRILESWFTLGVQNGQQILKALGLPNQRGRAVSSRDLGAVLDEEIRSLLESKVPQRQAAVYTLLSELTGLKSSLETAYGERDKFKADLGELNQRFSLLAQEMDEHSTKLEKNYQIRVCEMEKSYKDQLHDVQETLTKERFSGREDAVSEAKRFLLSNNKWREKEKKHLEKIEFMENELKRVESENAELGARLNEVLATAQSLEKQTVEMSKLKEKIVELESLSPREDEFRILTEKVEILKNDNQRLRDSNDELVNQVVSLSSKTRHSKPEELSLDGSCLGDYLESSMSENSILSGKKRSSSLSSPVRDSSSDDKEEDELDNPKCSKIRKTDHLNLNKMEVLSVSPGEESFADESMIDFNIGGISPLKSILEDISIVTSSNFEEKCSISSSQVKSLQCHQCKEMESRLNVALKELEMSLKREGQTTVYCCICQGPKAYVPLQFVIQEAFSDLLSKIKSKFAQESSNSLESRAKFGDRDMATILEEEEHEDGMYSPESLKELVINEVSIIERELDRIRTSWIVQKEMLEKDYAHLDEKYNELDQNYMYLKLEHDKRDDYWNMKLKEEQEYYEEEREYYDEKFAALEGKIKEYEEILANQSDSTESATLKDFEDKSSDSEERLSTIEESVVWEKQVTDLEKEIEALQTKEEQLNKEKQELEAVWEERLKALQTNHNLEMESLKESLKSSESTTELVKEQLNTIREELQHFKNSFGKEEDLEAFCDQDDVQTNDTKESNSKSKFLETPPKLQKFAQISTKMPKTSQMTLDLEKVYEEEKENDASESTKQMLSSLKSFVYSTLDQFKEEKKKVASSDVLICELYGENAELHYTVQMTERQLKLVEQQLRQVEMANALRNA